MCGRKPHDASSPEPPTATTICPIAPNRLAERAAPDGPNQVWLQDFTYVPTAQGWLYLALVLDLWSRKIVGWAIRDACSVLREDGARKGSLQGKCLNPNDE